MGGCVLDCLWVSMGRHLSPSLVSSSLLLGLFSSSLPTSPPHPSSPLLTPPHPSSLSQVTSHMTTTMQEKSRFEGFTYDDSRLK